ncbi:MAG: phage antirepressor N-terminal domain-containing protein [Chloroflexota bacterium]
MNALPTIEQKDIQFLDRQVTAVMVQDENGRENVYIPLRPLVEGMGLNWSSQYKRIKKNPVLNDVCISVSLSETEIGRGKGARKVLAIPISKLNGFLFGINANRVRSEIRPLIVAYQEKCYQVLFSAFNGTESMRRFYTAIGHDDGWIAARLEKHRYSNDLSDVWLINGVPIEHHEELESLINKGAFGLTTEEHKKHKNLPSDANLRDNMTRRELIFSMLGDEAAIALSENENPVGLEDNTKIAKAAGKIAGEQIDSFEQKVGGKVLSDQNHLAKQKKLKG